MADIRVSQVVAQIEWQEPSKNKVSQLVAQVEYQEPSKLKVSQLFVQVEYVEGTESGGEGGLFFAHG